MCGSTWIFEACLSARSPGSANVSYSFAFLGTKPARHAAASMSEIGFGEQAVINFLTDEENVQEVLANAQTFLSEGMLQVSKPRFENNISTIHVVCSVAPCQVGVRFNSDDVTGEVSDLNFEIISGGVQYHMSTGAALDELAVATWPAWFVSRRQANADPINVFIFGDPTMAFKVIQYLDCVEGRVSAAYVRLLPGTDGTDIVPQTIGSIAVYLVKDNHFLAQAALVVIGAGFDHTLFTPEEVNCLSVVLDFGGKSSSQYVRTMQYRRRAFVDHAQCARRRQNHPDTHLIPDQGSGGPYLPMMGTNMTNILSDGAYLAFTVPAFQIAAVQLAFQAYIAACTLVSNRRRRLYGRSSLWALSASLTDALAFSRTPIGRKAGISIAVWRRDSQSPDFLVYHR